MQKKNRSRFKEILNKYNYKLSDGDIVAGTIVYHEKAGFLVDIGTNTKGYLPQEEISIDLKRQKNHYLTLIDTTRDFFLVTQNIKKNQYILSIKRLDYIRAWKRIKQLYLEDIVFNLQIKHVNKGGVIIYLESIQGFIPNSHLFRLDNKVYIKNMQVKCKLLTANENGNQLILSNKSANLLISKHKLKLGELVYGKLIAIKSYGLFITINKVKALLHISEIGYKYFNTLKTIVKIGSLIKVKVIHLNIKQGLVSLSIKNVKNLSNHRLQY
uniref:Ribosomal protein S1 n=1 Tax=Polysiphonia scopulorum TaxID=257860 RepID=A0A1Z1MI18_9FLOR|nr:ribosomal protein S1 [Polysiphonia scopulorum]ARW65683.1 ribosomal protein S1 [Polysiphonia scopulorum]